MRRQIRLFIDRAVLVTWMVINAIFGREDHVTSDFKWRKTGLSSIGSTDHKASQKVEDSH